ncbi:MAG: DegT/DnrJ/EryC1/StrS family aminotransferase [Aquincola sp.]|nr:DegT/DnrJ/EryC1/StrS family aminotransferase [Aquincola sp.]MDH5332187.1 DegT/DnrJ/EryC1/StrS family aminotransferase [Aquincola sp.]
MKIPFVDLHAQYVAHRAEIDRAIAGIIEQTAFIGGEAVQRFERDFADDYGVAHCVSCANGTDAIYIALKMMGIEAGDEVITTAHSWISTSEAVSQTGATPVFVDVDEYYMLDVEQVERAITPRTRAVIPVHLYGQAADMTTVVDLCRRHGLKLLEDCAQAHYATWRGQRVGTFGNVATFSFYPGKNLGAYGDAGAIVTGEAQLAERMRMYANHGALKKHDHRMEGINSRLDGLQAAVLSAKLPHIHDWTRARQQVAGWYDKHLAPIGGVELPRVRDGATHVWHLYVIQHDDRDALARHLSERGVATAVHYPVALPLMAAYAARGFRAGQFPRAARNQHRILSLPMYPEMTEDMVRHVAGAIANFKKGR